MTEPVTIGIGPNKWIKDTNTKMITLNRSLANTTSAVQLNAVDYQVPVGKKFVILSISLGGYQQYFGAVGVNIYKGATAGATTTLLATLTASWGQHTYATGAGNGGNNIECYIEVEAGQYVNCSIVNGSYCNAVLTGVETNV